jgi:hypothetical protein
MKRFVVAVATLLFCASLALAQDTGQITGTVRDASGAVVPNAKVTVSNPAASITRDLVTNSDGEYLAAGLPGGSYNVTVSAAGFQKFQAKDVVLRVAQKARLDVNLQVGAANAEVTVEGQGIANVETQSSEVAGTVTGQQITQLQLNGRNFTQLVTLVPGVSNQTGQDEGTVGVYGNVAFSMNGGRTEYNNWELDGGDNMDNGSNATLNVYPSLEAISEVRVLTSNYGAQYGRNGSGTVEVETKSGTNNFHGGAYEFVRNDMFNARNYFDPVGSTPPYKKNDFGYTFGGPIKKDKLFFFWSQEWRRDRVPGQAFHVPVPSAANRQGNFADQCNTPNPTDCPIDPNTKNRFPNDQVSIDPNGQALLAMIPAGNQTLNGVDYFNASPPQPTNWREELGRIDYNITPKIRATYRFIHDSWDTVTPTTLWANSTFPNIQTHFIGPGVSMVAHLTATVSPTLLNEFVASYTTDHITLTNTGNWQRPSSMTMTGLFDNGFGGKLPGITVNTKGAYGGSFTEDAAYIPWKNSNPTYTLRDNVSKNHGPHNFQFGAYFVAAQKNEMASNNVQGFLTFDSGSGVSTGNGFADLLTGRIASFSQSSAQPKYYNRYKILEPYFQDDWRVNRNLTLNLGLRVSLYGTYREKYHQEYNWEPSAYDPTKVPQIDVDGSQTGQAGAFIPGTGNPYVGFVQCGGPGVPPGCMKGHLFNPAPRIGLAWDPTGTGKTAIRAAYGVFYEHTNGNEGNVESLEGSAPLVTTPTQYDIVGYTNIGGGLLFPLGATSIPTKAIWPYMQQWHLDVQHELITNTVATVSYVGSKGTHLTWQRDINQLHPVPASQNPFPAGQPITQSICDNMTVDGSPTGTPVTGQAAINLGVACGGDPNPYRPYLGFGGLTALEPQANSSYNALQMSLRHTGHGLTLTTAYTYGHSIDDSSDRYDGNFVDSYNMRRNRASSNFDQRHMLNIGYIYDIPGFKQAGLMHVIAGGWQLSGITTWQTGTPFSVVAGGFGDTAGVANGVGSGSFSDIVGDVNAIPAGSRNVLGLGQLQYNPAAFAEPTALTFGDSGRNRFRNPSRTNFDMSVFKHFRPTEATDIEFRAEAFNIFNHTQWSGVNNTPGSDNFLYPSGAHRARTMQFGLKFNF